MTLIKCLDKNKKLYGETMNIMNNNLQIQKIDGELGAKRKSEGEWDYVSGIFDSRASIEAIKIKEGLSLRIKFKSLPSGLVLWLKEFLGYGSLYIANRETPVLSISRKSHILDLLLNVQNRLIIKRDIVNYLLNNFNFGSSDNSLFNLLEFKALRKRRI